MNRQTLIDEIKFKLTGGVLELELSDTALSKVVDAALRELQRYITSIKFVTIDYSRCIDMKPYKASTVTKVYRTKVSGLFDDREMAKCLKN